MKRRSGCCRACSWRAVSWSRASVSGWATGSATASTESRRRTRFVRPVFHGGMVLRKRNWTWWLWKSMFHRSARCHNSAERFLPMRLKAPMPTPISRRSKLFFPRDEPEDLVALVIPPPEFQMIRRRDGDGGGRAHFLTDCISSPTGFASTVGEGFGALAVIIVSVAR